MNLPDECTTQVLWRRREGVEPSEDLTAPKTGFEDQRHHRAPSFSEPTQHSNECFPLFYGKLPHMSQPKDLFSELPSVDRLLKHAQGESLLVRFNRDYVIQQCRAVLDELRNAIRQGHSVPASELNEESVLRRIEQ